MLILTKKIYIVLLYIVSSYEFFNYAPVKLLSGSFVRINRVEGVLPGGGVIPPAKQCPDPIFSVCIHPRQGVDFRTKMNNLKKCAVTIDYKDL